VKNKSVSVNPRILYLITTLDVGGAEVHLLSLVKGLQKVGPYEFEVVYLKGYGTLEADFARLGVPVRKVSLERWTDLPQALGRLVALMRVHRYSLVHTHLLKADFVGAMAARVARVPVVISSKHNDERPLRNSVWGFLHGLSTRLDDQVIVISDHVGEYMAAVGRVDRRKMRRIYYGLDWAVYDEPMAGPAVREEFQLGDETFVLGIVARLAPQKGYRYLLEALTQVIAKRPEVRLLIVGDDPFYNFRAELKAWVQTLRLQNHVIFTGIRHDVPRLMRGLDLLVSPSLWEGFGLVLLEAMAARKPILASRVSAIPEIVVDGETGRLVPPGDTDALAQGILYFLEHPDEGCRMGQAGRERLERLFPLRKMIAETAEVYERHRQRKESAFPLSVGLPTT